jgi:serine/threonine protein kinase
MAALTMTAAPARLGRYRITGTVGRGGMGTVYRGHDEALGRDVAVKVIHDRFGSADNVIRRFGEEAKNVARLSSPHIVQVFEFDPLAAPPFLAMELVRGPSLQAIVRALGRASVATVADCARQVLAGLATAHAAGIIHRDIKPANVLRGPDGIYKLTDFGLARSLEREQSLTASGSVIGTLHYMAPEVAAGEEATAASDLYSLGVTLYELLAGTTPFPADSPLKLLRRIAAEEPLPIRAHRDDMPPAFEAWLEKLLARDPARRFSSAAAALDALRQVEIPAAGSDDFGTVPFEVQACDADAATTPTPRLHAEPREPIHREQVDSIIRTAARLEAQGRSLVGDDTILDIARELNVDSMFVRRALDDHRAERARAATPPPASAPPPWQPTPPLPAAARLDPAARRACANAIDRIWWASVVALAPSIPVLDLAIGWLVGLRMERVPLRFLAAFSPAFATAAGMIQPLFWTWLCCWVTDLIALALPPLTLLLLPLGIAVIVMACRLWWNTLSGTADLLEQAAAPAEAMSIRSARFWGLWLVIAAGLAAGVVGVVVEARTSNPFERRLVSWCVELASLPVLVLLTWLFTLRPLALASATLRRSPRAGWEMPA